MRASVLILALCAPPAFADVKSSTKTVDCYCTDKGGSRIELGQTICMQVDGRMFTARCEMSLNVPMWREQQEGCLSSALPQSLPAPDTNAHTGPETGTGTDAG